ncbi:5'-AMP-activated protein kinase subunit beta-2-like isoform X2 [Physella acuta]|uniref:5'-AMP-activated protein kinase subunit beta-2-like isoform X2 n=1 Tax=Physella acuta TaxID=109671 RepID=UPI0027DD95E8|nr:5'-AMP-activated protein kinase subunit beta-2-like isoform X2 [Physella acuta]
MGNSSSAKNRHGSGEDTAPTLTANTRYAESESYEPTYRRQRAATLTPGQDISVTPGNKLLPTVFKWEGGGKEVFLAGSFNNWKTKIPLAKSHGDFYTILDLPEGDHQYKFFVDGQWVNSPNDPVTNSDIGTQNNTMRVKRSDFDAFEALAIDGRAAKKADKNDYGQEIPPRGTTEGKHSGPPFLPPQLLQVILNKDTPAHVEPSLLPEPNHVMLNHLYALSIKDGVMVLSATHRFRKKYVTTLLYKPIQ